MALYDNAMQVVPVLLIALFLDTRSIGDRTIGRLGQWWERMQDRIFALLGVAAFMVSMFVVSGVTEDGSVTKAIVISALSGCISLLELMPSAHTWQAIGGDTWISLIRFTSDGPDTVGLLVNGNITEDTAPPHRSQVPLFGAAQLSPLAPL